MTLMMLVAPLTVVGAGVVAFLIFFNCAGVHQGSSAKPQGSHCVGARIRATPKADMARMVLRVPPRFFLRLFSAANRVDRNTSQS